MSTNQDSGECRLEGQTCGRLIVQCVLSFSKELHRNGVGADKKCKENQSIKSGLCGN